MTNNLIIDSIGKLEIEKIQDLEIQDLDNIFIFYRNIYDSNGNITKSFLEVAQEYYLTNKEFTYKNIIILPEERNTNSLFDDNVMYIIWFAKRDDSFFNKDSIRESHIWKDVEWGKRKKNYSEKGKDPSNVWIPTLDNGKGKITQHIYLKIEGAVDRIFNAFTDFTSQTDWYYYNFEALNQSSKDTIKKLLRNSSNSFLEREITVTRNISQKRRNNEVIVTNRIIFGTSEKINKKSDSVDLVVTSPPYWNLKDYFKEGQIGQESYESYLERLNKVWKECIRLMKPNTLLWININIRKHKKIPYFLPSDYIRQLKKLGLYFKEVFIWHKSSSIPTTNKNLSDKFEVFLVFSNSNNIKVNSQVVSNFNEYKNDNLRYGTIWNINRKAGSVGKKFIHPAIFPTELIERVISISTDEKELILDPFLGSGTSGVAAINKNRYFWGVEYNEGFKQLIEHRITAETNIDFDKKILIEYDK